MIIVAALRQMRSPVRLEIITMELVRCVPRSEFGSSMIGKAACPDVPSHS